MLSSLMVAHSFAVYPLAKPISAEYVAFSDHRSYTSFEYSSAEHVTIRLAEKTLSRAQPQRGGGPAKSTPNVEESYLIHFFAFSHALNERKKNEQ